MWMQPTGQPEQATLRTRLSRAKASPDISSARSKDDWVKFLVGREPRPLVLALASCP